MADAPNIVAYLKPVCGWSNGVRETFRKYDLSYEDKDIINNPDIYAEMVQKSGQPLSPCVEINGEMLPDVSGEEVEAWMIEKGLVQASSEEPDAPIHFLFKSLDEAADLKALNDKVFESKESQPTHFLSLEEQEP